MKLDKIIKYRSVWMAFAILWVILFHSMVKIPNSTLDFIKSIGYGGVDIFIFASGLGCYYSLSKDSDPNRFLKRRFDKLMPTFWCFLTVFIIYKKLHKGIGISAIIGNILCIQTFTFKGNSFNWYICCIWLFYFLAPYIYSHTNRIKKNLSAVSYILLLLLFSIPFVRCNNLIIMITRLPLFFMGMYCAKLSMKKNYTLSKPMIISLIISMVIGLIILKYCYIHYEKYLWSYGLHWYPFILIVPGLCICISFLCSIIENKNIGKRIINFMNFVGKNTFELYLVHTFIFEIVSDKINKGDLNNSNLLWIKCFIIVIIASIILKYLTKFVLFICSKISENKYFKKISNNYF